MPQLLFQFQRNGNSPDGPVMETLIHILNQKKLNYDGIQKEEDGIVVDFSNSDEAKTAFKLDGMEVMGSVLAIKPSSQSEIAGNGPNKENYQNRYSKGYREDYSNHDGYPEQRDRGGGGRQRYYQKQQQRYGNYCDQHQQDAPPQKIEQYPRRILIPSDMVKVVLGKGGATITAIQSKTDTKIDVHRDKNNHRNRPSEDTMTSIKGDPVQFSEAIMEILQVMNSEYENRNYEEARPLQLKILAHDLLCGRIIGKGGNNLKKVRQDSGVTKLIISNSIYDEGNHFVPSGLSSSGERVITIEGTTESISSAEKILSQRLRDYMEKDLKNTNNYGGMMGQGGYYQNGGMNGYSGGYNQQMYPQSPYGSYRNPMGTYMGYYPHYPAGYMNNHPGLLGQGYPPFPNMMATPPPHNYEGDEETCCISIPTKEVGAIIGRNGVYINKVKHYSNAQVRVVKGDEDDESRVEVKGTPDAQWRASLCVFGKIKETMKVPYSEAQLKTEYLVPGSCVGRIIGKKGQVVQDIQDKAQTDIEVPKDKQGGDDVPVYITGTFNGTQVALNRIRDIVQRARSKPPLEDHNSGP